MVSFLMVQMGSDVTISGTFEDHSPLDVYDLENHHDVRVEAADVDPRRHLVLKDDCRHMVRSMCWVSGGFDTGWSKQK